MITNVATPTPTPVPVPKPLTEAQKLELCRLQILDQLLVKAGTKNASPPTTDDIRNLALAYAALAMPSKATS